MDPYNIEIGGSGIGLRIIVTDYRFNEVYLCDNLPDKIKDGSNVINLDEYADIGTRWIVLYSKDNTKTYFDSFGVEHTPKGIKKFINGSTITTNIFRIQANVSVM